MHQQRSGRSVKAQNWSLCLGALRIPPGRCCHLHLPLGDVQHTQFITAEYNTLFMLSGEQNSDRFGKTLIPQNWNNTLGNKSTYQGGQYTIVRFNRSAGSLSQEIESNNLNGDWHLCTGLSACWQEKLSSLRELLHFVPSVSELLSVPCSHHLESRCPCLVPLGWDVANSALSALITSPGTCAVSWDWSVSQRCGTEEW